MVSHFIKATMTINTTAGKSGGKRLWAAIMKFIKGLWAADDSNYWNHFS